MNDTFYVNKTGFLDDLVADIEARNEAEQRDDFENRRLQVGFKRLNDAAILPTKAFPTDSGFDLYASEDVIIEPGETAIVPIGIAVQLPEGYEAQVRPRSGVTSKTKLRVQLGTIDEGYTGEVGVIVDNIAEELIIRGDVNYLAKTIEGKRVRIDNINGGEESNRGTYLIRKGDRIAQIVVQALPEVTAVEIEEFTEGSERGEGAFGSTGV